MRFEELTNKQIDRIETACEGKTVLTLTFNPESGIIIRFTDGSIFKMFVTGEVFFNE